MRFRTVGCVALLVLSAAIPSSASAQVPCNTWQEGFGAPGPDAPFQDFATFDDGSGPALYTCGRFRGIGGDPAQGVVRWTGSRWVQVGTGLYDVNTLTVFDDGSGAKLVAGGSFTTAFGAAAHGIAVWTGSQWVPLAGPPLAGQIPDVDELASFDDGSGPALFVTGYLELPGQGSARAARWQNGAWFHATAGIDSYGAAGPLAVFDAGSGLALYLGSGGGGTPSLLRWSGSSWTDAAPGFVGIRVRALQTWTSGGSTALYVTGMVSLLHSPWNGIARFDGTSVTALGSGLETEYPSPYPTALAVHDFGSGSRLVVGGDFDGAGGVRSRGLASWDGSAWSSLTPPFGSYGVTALASFDDGSGPALFAGGNFTEVGGLVIPLAARLQHGAWSGFARGNGLTTGATLLRSLVVDGERSLLATGCSAAGSTAVRGIARFDGSRWHALGSLNLGWIRTMIEADLGAGPRVYAGGGTYGTTHSVFGWDGTSWSPVGSTFGEIHALASFDDGSGMALYAAGHMVGGPVKRWNGTQWDAVGTFPMFSDYEVHDLCVHDDGSGPALYASGEVGQGRKVTRWTGTSWTLVGQVYIGETESQLLSFDDGGGPQLVLRAPLNLTSGSFWIARWDGSSWSGIPTFGTVTQLGVFHDGIAPRLCITRAGGGSMPDHWSRVSKHVEDKWVDLGVVNGGAATMAGFDGDHDGVPELFVGGGIKQVEGIPSVGIARYMGCATAGATRCAGDGSATACPCGNSGATGHGCANSVHASGARLTNGGLASITGDTLHLDADALTGSFAIFAQGTALSGGTGVPFQDGLLCTGGVVTRLGSAPIAGGSASFPQAGGARLSQLGSVTMPGQRRVYQTIYRNQASFCTSGAANATNGLHVTWSL